MLLITQLMVEHTVTVESAHWIGCQALSQQHPSETVCVASYLILNLTEALTTIRIPARAWAESSGTICMCLRCCFQLCLSGIDLSPNAVNALGQPPVLLISRVVDERGDLGMRF